MNASHFYTTINSPLGEIALTSLADGRITGIYTQEHPYYAQAKTGIDNPLPFQLASKQLHEYFVGKRGTFDLPLVLVGTAFQQQVWQALSDIGYGETKSYGEIARSLNIPNASRAVGLANSKNPFSIIVPCHRVIGSNGRLTGYAGGIKVKAWLLRHEAEVLKQGHPTGS